MMENADIRVQHVAVSEIADLNVFVVALAEEPLTTGRRIELQRALKYDLQDKELGMDTYCVSTSWGPSLYGGIEGVTLKDRVLTIEFKEDAARVLDLPPNLLMEVAIDEASLSALREGLKRIFRDGEAVGRFLV